MNTSHANSPRAVLWDFGGVILSSPFEAFRRYEREAGLPEDFIRSLNARNPDANAWAKMERSEVSLDEFVALFESEAEAHGHALHQGRRSRRSHRRARGDGRHSASVMTPTEKKPDWKLPRQHRVANLLAGLSIVYFLVFVLWLLAFEPRRGVATAFAIWAINT